MAPDITGTGLVNGSSGIDVHDDHVISVRSVSAFDRTEGWQQGDRAVLLDGKGVVLWEKAFSTRDSDPRTPGPFPGPWV